MDMQEAYRKLKKKKDQLVYAHCKHCYEELPRGESMESYSKLEGIMDCKTGVLTLCCIRHETVIVCAILPDSVVKSLNVCNCAACREATRQ